MYLVGIVDGKHPCGNTGTIKVSNRSHRYIKGIAERFGAMNALDMVYGIPTYTQHMCEMENAKFTETVKKVGILLYVRR